MSIARRNSWPNRNSQMAGWTTLNDSTHGCLTRACSLRPVRYQVCARAVPNGTVLDGAVLDGTVLDGTVLDGTVLDGAPGVGAVAVAEFICMVVITCSPQRSRALSPGHHVRPDPGHPTRGSGVLCAAGTRR